MEIPCYNSLALFVNHLVLSLNISQIHPIVKSFSSLPEQGETENMCLQVLACVKDLVVDGRSKRGLNQSFFLDFF